MTWGIRASLTKLLLTVSLSLIAAQSYAQSDQERATARVAAKEGIKAFKEERYADAVKYLERAEAVVHAPTHLLFIARARAKLGRFVQAREAYQKLINENLASSAPQAFRNAQESGREEIKTVESKIASVRFQLVGPGGTELKNVRVKIGSDDVPTALLDLPVPANPGTHVVVATADGMNEVRSEVTLEAGGSGEVTLTFEEGASSAPAPITPPVEDPEPVSEKPAAQTEPPPREEGNTVRTLGWVGIGSGVALAGAGGALWFVSSGQLDKTTGDEEFCVESECTAEGISEINRAKTLALLGDVAMGAGVVALGVGTALLLSSKKKKPRDVGVRRLVPVAHPQGGFFVLEGGFR